MLIILARHAEREYRPDRADADQQLTPKGEETARRLGQHLVARLQAEGRSVGRILTSSYRRASQTATLLAPALELSPDRIEPVAALQTAPDGSVEAALPLVLAAAEMEGVIAVGHGPDLADLSHRLCGLPVQLKKAQAIAIEWDAQTETGRLLWQVGHKAGQM